MEATGSVWQGNLEKCVIKNVSKNIYKTTVYANIWRMMKIWRKVGNLSHNLKVVGSNPTPATKLKAPNSTS